jgi:hypothetical protein
VIAGRDEVDPGGEHLVGRLAREPEAAGGIFAVGDHDVDVVLFANERQMFGERLATGGADDVGNGQDRDILL